MYNSYNLKANDPSLISSEIINIIFEFKKYLLLQKISSGSLRSYLSDVRHFLSWLLAFLVKQGFSRILSTDSRGSVISDNPLEISENLKWLLKQVNQKVLEAFRDQELTNNVPIKTINRRFSSLRKFGIFCQSQKWCSLLAFDTLKNIPVVNKPFPEDSYHLEEFRINLWKNKSSKATIKNYLNDVKQFLAFSEKEIN